MGSDWCDVVDVVRGDEASGAGHVLGDDTRIARDVPGDVVADEARRDVVAGADVVADDQLDLPVLVEIIGAGGRARGQCGDGCGRGDGRIAKSGCHVPSPCVAPAGVFPA